MQTVKFTQALKRFYPDLGELKMEAENLSEILNEVERRFQGIKSYLVDDQGALRQHVNIFVDGKMIDDREGLSDAIGDDCEIYIMQALSGG